MHLQRITYEFERDGLAEQRELPFVVGIIGDLAGQPEMSLPIFAERRFVRIDSATFDQVMADVSPRLICEVEDGAGCLITIGLTFRTLLDFEPEQILKQLKGLLKLPPDLLFLQMERILDAPEWRKMKDRWHGLRFLISSADSDAPVRFQILSATKKELRRDLLRAPEVSQSALFKKIHDDVFGKVGHAPFSVLISDLEFGPAPADVELLARISGVAAAVHAPFLAIASPEGFDMETVERIAELRYPEKVHKGAEYARWNAFRRSENSNYVGLVLPRNSSRFLSLTDAIWRFSRRVIRSFEHNLWFAGIQEGAEESLAHHRRNADTGELGFIFCDPPFPLPSTTHKPEALSLDDGLTSRRSTQLAYLFALLRFAQYLKVMVRDHLLRFESPLACERFLQEWLEPYTEGANRPLQSAHVHLLPGQEATVYHAVLRAAPCYQLQELIWGLRVVITLEPGKILS